MLFNSIEFVVFLSLVLLVYGSTPRHLWRVRKGILVAASYAFYMSWRPAYGALLGVATLLGFVLPRLMEGARTLGQRRALLAGAVIANLALLGFFKYGAFLMRNVAELLRPLLGSVQVPDVGVALPVGISFYTFESLAYAIDVYRGMPACRSLLDFTLFLSFFPHLVAGPIVRPGPFLAQLKRPPTVSEAQIEEALGRIATGLAKKILLADSLGGYVDVVFGAPALSGGGDLLLAVYAYAFQIYFDFSGYTDIAIGVAALFGLRLPENFDRPYLAASPREFWRRWHISLSTWLRDYLYVPLGGSRGSAARTYVNLFLTMLLGGLWHGASWTFVVWGGYHGVLLAADRFVIGDRDLGASRAALAWRRVLTFHLVCGGWILFRAPTLTDAATIVRGFASLAFAPSWLAIQTLVIVAFAVLLHHGQPAPRWRAGFARLSPGLQGASYAVLAAVLFLCSPASQRFIYFQF